ncbi:MAG: hypothetical protein C4334_06885 [Pyrinomonas sp.]|uniref:DUF4388 domain-containing protein n=1 Tax=Pyrinomonas sp. TaxID=2080306 RepID=UPI00332009C4
MSGQEYRGIDAEIEAALLDSELFIKYGSMGRAISRLQEAIARYPHSIELRERLREVAATMKLHGEAARQCLALARLYIERENFDAARERLLKAKEHAPAISIAAGLEAIRRARRPEIASAEMAKATPPSAVILAGDLALVSIFDCIQTIENSRLTGALAITGSTRSGRILFNDGQIVDAECGAERGVEAFRALIEAAAGTFNFERGGPYPAAIAAASNTSLLLETLRQLDEERAGDRAEEDLA